MISKGTKNLLKLTEIGISHLNEFTESTTLILGYTASKAVELTRNVLSERAPLDISIWS